MSEKTTQNAWVLEQLEYGAVLSSRDAVIRYGIQDLPKRISELRREGHKIQSVRVTGEGRNGAKTHWNEYWLV